MLDQEQFAKAKNHVDGRIVEVYWDQDKEVTVRTQVQLDQNNRPIFVIEKRKGGWHPKRVRQDKRLPND